MNYLLSGLRFLWIHGCLYMGAVIVLKKPLGRELRFKKQCLKNPKQKKYKQPKDCNVSG